MRNNVMAKSDPFQPMLDTGKVSDFTSASKGQSADKSLATLFSGTGDIVEAAAQGQQSVIIDNLHKDIREGYQKETSIFTDASSATANASEKDVTSSKVEKDAESLKKLKDAYDQGKISDMAYSSRLVMMTKDLKEKYRGYEDIVDKSVQSVTGIRPANELRKEVLRLFEQNNVDKLKNERDWESFIDKNSADATTLFPDIYTNKEKYASAEARAKVKTALGMQQGQRSKITDDLQKLQARKGLDEEQRAIAIRGVQDQLNYMASNSLNGITSIMEDVTGQQGLTLPDFLKDLADGKRKISDEQIVQIGNRLNLHKENVARRMREVLAEGGMAADEIEKQVKSALTPYDDFTKALGTKDFRGVNNITEINRLKQERDTGELLKNKDIRRIRAIQNALPEYIKGNPGAFTSTIQGAVAGFAIADVVDGKGASLNEGVSTILDSTQLTQKEKQQGLKTLYDGAVSWLEQPTTNENRKQKLEFFNTNGDMYKKLSVNDRVAYFEKMTSPRVLDSITKSGDKELMSAYVNFTTREFKELGIFTEMTNEVVSSVKNVSQFSSVSRKEDGSYDIIVDPAKFNQMWSSAGPVEKMAITRELKSAQQNLDKLNRSFTPVREVLKAAGHDEQMQKRFLENTMLDFSGSQESWGRWIARGLDISGKVTGMGIQHFMKSPYAPKIVNSDKFSDLDQPPEKLEQVTELLDGIGKAEGADYDTVYGNVQKSKGWKPTQMTISQVYDAQKEMVRDGHPSGAFGKYQILNKTLRGAVAALNIPEDAVFDTDTQDRIAVYLLKQRGLDDYLAGNLSGKAFKNRLAKEWASIPDDSGESYYKGVAGNKATSGGRQVAALLDKV